MAVVLHWFLLTTGDSGTDLGPAGREDHRVGNCVLNHVVLPSNGQIWR